MRVVAAIAACVAAVVGAIAVGVPGAAADGGRSDGPCALLTRKEIARIVGQRASKGSDALGPTFCQWNLARSADRGRGQVNALMERGRRAKADFATARTLDDAQPVADLGRAARYTPSSGTLWVLAPGPTLFYVQANVYDPGGSRIDDGLLDMLVALANRAAARL